jgi:hypothetical protein
MEYHLHRRGQNVGVFPLEELRRRRDAGELSGEDLVWSDGMADWASLDSVLQAKGLITPPLLPVNALNPKGHRLPVWGKLAIGLAVLLGVTVTGLVAVKFLQGFRNTVQQRVLMSSSDGLEVAGKPVVVDSKTLTQEDIRKRKGAFRVRQYVDGYRKYGRHTAAWDADALQMIKSWIAGNYGGPNGLPDARALSNKLVAQPDCDDPLVWMVTGVNTFELHEATRRMERAVAGFENSKYQAYPKFFANVYLATELGGESPRIPSLDEVALRYFKQALADGSFQPGDEEEVADVLVSDWGKSFFARNGDAVCKAVRQSGEYPWLALVLEGELETDVAWKLRGSGFANTVTSEGWEGFASHLSKARTALTQAWEIHPGWPLAPSQMIYVSLGDADVGQMRTWFDRTLSAQIDYWPAWWHMRWGLRPRWYGSHAAMLALGVLALDTKRFDTDVPRVLFDCIKDIEIELQLPPGKHIYGRSDIWPHLKRMYEGYLAEPSQAQWRDGWRSTYAAVAYLAGDYNAAREQLEAVNWKPVPENLTGWGVDLSLMPLKVAALTGTAGAKVEAAEESYDLRDLAEAIELYTKLNTAADTDEQTREFCGRRLAALQQEKLLAKGEWIDLMPADDKDPNWVFWGGKLRRLSDGALEVESGPSGHGFYSRTRVGRDFEVTGEFEVVHSSTKDFQAGLMMGLPDSHNSVWYGFRMKRNVFEGQVVSFSSGWTRHQSAVKTALNDTTNSFRFRMQANVADAWLNGNKVLHQDSGTNAVNLYNDSMLGIGAFNDMNETVIRYRNVKARRVTGGK